MQKVQIYKASPRNSFLNLRGSLVFVAFGLWMACEKPVFGWILTGLFSLVIPAANVMLLPGVVQLRLDEAGFEVLSLMRRETTRWKDVKSFKLDRGNSGKVIAIEYQPSYANKHSERDTAHALVGIEGGIPNNDNIALKELKKERNMRLQQSRQTNSAIA
jgi:hypothetical protein